MEALCGNASCKGVSSRGTERARPVVARREEDEKGLGNLQLPVMSISAVQLRSNGGERLTWWTVFHLPSTPPLDGTDNL